MTDKCYSSRDELYHHGVKGMKWGVRRDQTKPSWRSVRKSIDKAKKTGRLIDDGNPIVLGVRQKNGDILFVSRMEVYEFGVDIAESRAKDDIKERRKNAKKATNSALRKTGKISVTDAKKDLDAKLERAFKKHPELYDDFGGPDQVDDTEFLALVMTGYGFGADIDF